VVALTLRTVLAVVAAWLTVGAVVGLTLGRFLRDTDRAARQLYHEERRRRNQLDELAPRRRRRPQR